MDVCNLLRNISKFWTLNKINLGLIYKTVVKICGKNDIKAGRLKVRGVNN